MRNIDWPPGEIDRIARTSGKPFEVECAEAFLAAGWMAGLGSYYADGALDVPRELDVLAHKSVELDVPTGVNARVRALVSCRAFPKDRSPLFYSVSATSVPSYKPRLFVEHRGPWTLEPGAPLYGPLPALEIKSASCALAFADLTTARPIVAFDMIERIEDTRKQKKGQLPVVTYARVRDGDSNIFKAVESAIKASFFWRQEDYQWEGAFATLNVPVCVLNCPFWDACLDLGHHPPETFSKGWMVNLYPARPHAKELMCLVWSSGELAVLITALNGLFTWFADEMKNAYRASKPT